MLGFIISDSPIVLVALLFVICVGMFCHTVRELKGMEHEVKLRELEDHSVWRETRSGAQGGAG